MAAPKTPPILDDTLSFDAQGKYQRRVTYITTPEGVRLPFITATFAERLGAFILDYLIIIAAPVALILLFFILPFEQVDWKRAKGLGDILMILFFMAMFFVRTGYFMAFEMGPRAATPGKRVLKIRVIAHDGGHLTPVMVITRNMLREVEFYLPLTLMGMTMQGGGWVALSAFLWTLVLALLPLFNRDQARLGDFLGGTRVVHMPRQSLGIDLADTEADRRSGIMFSRAQIEAYGEKELGVLEEVLRERRPATMAAVATRIKTRIGWDDPKNTNDVPTDEAFLRAFYAALRAHLESRMLLGKRRKDKHDEVR
ncbi:RDD family protein [Asticcacaulis endophyticus]|uniref:RDD domain-containing protein n=1 Tax=Asticcacaulis endophyticus TaxID=1395890 RepID=A0A918UP75_9CAUL|nr:RDD family protein [Asticcacaulis endophyticus]GGZ24239.1 hypothetical protein GCM10011273_06750 [Asticcacaulis endophyticus]